MLRLPSARDHQLVLDAIEAAPTEGMHVALGFFLDEDDYSNRLDSAEWSQPEIPITLDAKLIGHLPPHLTDARVRYLCEIEGKAVPLLYSEKTTILTTETDYMTDLWASSAGSLLGGEDAIRLDSYAEFSGATPDTIASQILRLVPYDHNLVQVDPVPGVTLDYIRGTSRPGFLAEESTGDVLGKLAAEQGVGYSYRDRANRGFVAEIPIPLGHTTQATSGLPTFNANQLPNWERARPAPSQTLWRQVRVFAQDPTTGELLHEVFEDIPYVGLKNVPHKGRTLSIPFEDTSANATANMRRLAVQTALELARRPSSGTDLLLPAFNPLIEKQDRLKVIEAWRDDREGVYERLWMLRIEAPKHTYGSTPSVENAGTLATAIAYSALMLEESKIAVPTFIVPARSSAIVRSIAPFGNDDGGFWINPTLTSAYAAADTDAFWIDPATAGAELGNDADGFWIND